MFVIDPHGDLVAKCLAGLPQSCLSRAYVLDLEDEEYPFGVNLFAIGDVTSEIQLSQAINRITHVFHVLWPETEHQAMLPIYLQSAIIALVHTPGATLVDMLEFLEKEDFRAHVLRNTRIPANIRAFWRDKYDLLPKGERERRVQALTNRLYGLFMGKQLVSNIVGQRKATVHFRRAIENHELIFIKLPVNNMKLEAQLIGMFIAAQITAAVFSFSDLPEEQRPGVSWYVDEFQNFTTPDFDVIITQARKYKARLVLAHQYRAQMPSYLQHSTLQSRTVVSFQVEPDDARELAALFPIKETELRPEVIEPHVSDYLLKYGSESDEVQDFVEWFLLPLQGEKRGSKIDIRDRQLGGNWLTGHSREFVYVADPTPWLDQLLYQVMRSGDPTLPIPMDIPLGFSNGGVGHKTFFQQAVKAAPCTLQLNQFPPHLVIEGHWTREPETSKEAYLFLCFALRQVMHFLAANPIGKGNKKSAPKTTEVAQMISSLPPRSAFVRTGKDLGVIYTYNTPGKVTGQELTERLQLITEHTHAKYCRPREAIEEVFTAVNEQPEQTAAEAVLARQVAGWGVVSDEP